MPDTPEHSRTPHRFGLFSAQGILVTVCAVLIVITVALWVQNRDLANSRKQPTPPPLEEETPGSVFAFMVPPGILGSHSRTRQVVIPNTVSIVKIDLALDRLWVGGDYNITISSEGNIVWSQAGSAPKGATKVTALAPRDLFSKGRYRVALAEPRGDAGPDALNYYDFVVH
jgi:hypothetical protein